jgi:hypothetical protein
MKKTFLDEDKPIYTCNSESCDNCEVGELVTCHFNLKLLMKFLLFAIPSFIIAIIGICINHWGFLIPWVLSVLLYFGLIEIRVMCSHCPHYAEPGTRTLKCWANYGSPKLWKYRPGPMSMFEKIIFFAGLAIVFLYPPAIMVLSGQYILTSIFLIYTAIGFYLMKRFMCKKCMNFACPLNMLDEKTKQEFKKKNPKT